MSKKSYIWNTIASSLNSAISAVLLLVVIRILGVESGGIFALGYSIAQMMSTIGYYDMRAYQASDVSNVYLFGDYFFSRVITCSVMIVVSFAYVGFRGYYGIKFAIVFLLCIFKMTDALEDVYHAQLQKLDRLDIAGVMQTMRLIVCIIVFIFALQMTENLLLCCAIMTVISILMATIPDIYLINKYEPQHISFDRKKVFGLLSACMPLCVGSYLALYIGNAPKYAIDTYMSNADQSYYNIIFLPSYMINLFSGFILRPTVTTMARDWNESRYRVFLKHITKLFFTVIVLTMFALLVAYMFGIQILGAFYNVDIDSYRPLLLLLLAGGGFHALGIVTYYAITITRKQKYMLIVNALVAALAFFGSPVMVARLGLYGATVSYLFLTAIRYAGFLLIFIIIYRSRVKHMSNKSEQI